MTATSDPKPAHDQTRSTHVTTMFRRGLVAVLLVAGLVVMPRVARATVIHTVCASGCEFTSVEAGVMASSAGDAIEVMPGTYREQVVVDKPLSIFGATGVPRPVIEFDGMLDATVTIAATGAGTRLSDLDIRGIGESTFGLQANGAVTATDLDLAATGACAFLAAPTPSQLGPGVTATTTGGFPYACVTAGGNAADIVTGITVRAPDVVGVVLGGAGTLTDATINAGTALILQGGSIARRSTLNGAIMGVEAASGLSPSAPLLSDSVVTSTADRGIAVFAPSVNMFQAAVRLRNVTAVASGLNSTGIEAQAQITSSSTADSIDARNVIARGTGRDVFGEPAGGTNCNGSCAPGQVIIGYSNFRSADGVVDSTIGHDESADPLLVNPTPGAGQDFHIAGASSPLIGAGTPDASDGPSDRDGVAHAKPPAIGAYEYSVSPAAQPSNPPPGPTPPAPNTPSSMRPTISRLAETNAVFAAARTSTLLHGRTASASHKRGTVFSFRLNQAAAVTVVISATTSCRRRTAAPHGKPRCPRAIATLTRGAHAGANRLTFTGRIRGRPLKPGHYRAVFVATNTGGSSAPTTLQFRIVAR
jgi:hypothetical protein